MAKWEKPPRSDHDLLKEWLETNVKGCSAAYGMDYKLQHLEIPHMADDDLAILMSELQARFPQAF